MPKVGSYSYPKLNPDKAVNIAKTLVKEHDGSPANEEHFAQTIGHSTSNSGAYISKIADLRKYGIIQKRGLDATETAENLVFPRTDEEEREAKFEMFRNIELLNELYDELNGNTPPDNLWTIIHELTDCSRSEAKEAEEDIRDLYQRMLEYQPSEDQGESASEGIGNGESDSGENTKTSDEGILVRVDGEEMNFAKTDDNIDIAIQFLKSKKED